MIFFFFVSALATFRPDHAVSLSVVAPWYGVPVFEQMLFYVADFSENAAKTFILETLESFDRLDDVDFLWSKAKPVLTPDAIPLMEAQVENGFFLPRAEMFREIARSIGGSKYPDLMVTGSLDNLDFQPDLHFDSNVSNSYIYDITFGESNRYIYANLHNSTVAQIIVNLLKSDIPFILRPTSKTDKFGIDLHGFGIEMRPFKYSMEYGVKDTIVLDSAKTHNDTVTDVTVEKIKGIPPSYIDMSKIEVLGIKLASFLRSHGAPFLELLRDITNNFPLFMPQICSSEETKEDVSAFNKVHRLIAEKARSIINGRSVPLKNVDIFSLLDIINQEKNFRTILESHFKMDLPLVKKISSMEFTENGEYILEYRSNLIRYLNDIEKDPEYSELSTEIAELYNSMVGFPMVRKNLINIIFIGSPLVDIGAQSMAMLSYLVDQNLPIRVGIVPYLNLGNKLERKVAYAFHHISMKSQSDAVRFIINTITMTIKNEDDLQSPKMPTEQDFADQFNMISVKNHDSIKWNELYRLFDASSDESKLIEETNRYITKIGVKTNTVLLNGRSINIESIQSQTFLLEIQRSVQAVQQVIYERGFRSLPRAHIMDLLSDHFTVLPSLDIQVFDETPQSIGLVHQSLSHQLSFVNYLSEIEWNSTDKGLSVSFFLLFCPEGTDTSIFEEFMHENHSLITSFAINPPFPDSVYRIDHNKVTLITNGRVFNDFDLKDIGKLRMIDVWSESCLYKAVKPSINSIRYKRSEALSYLLCIITDWLSDNTERVPIPDEVFQINSNLIHNTNTVGMHWDIIANPFSRDFQRVADIVYYIDKLKVVDVRLAIVPPVDLESDITTISTYYRNALKTDRAIFTMLNDTTTYSVMPDMPNTWIFESMKASVDLDNIMLKELNPSTHEGRYVLTNIMAEGICYTSQGEFAEGAELALIDTNNNRKSDTIVMMSNGYWQLPANPGRFVVELGGKRSKTIYEMTANNDMLVSTFATGYRRLVVKVNKGMEGLKVYNVSITDTSNATRVDVFSVASGHLYERLLKIMMMAVRRQSKYNVKFWLIKAFLSPQFKATLPIMAKRYNFSYELVSYKWPTWLYPQYEKQRIIWGNKILFLDVLFPLDLERVVYIDSDQIVRTDLIELMRMDFGNAPYAFTPFCDSRKETEPYRFWKQGYWKDLLGTKKYHISALFAIDLRRFRQMAAGDWLRHHYQQMAPDPGSLSNLDQDLPNYAQTHIPIYSLPQNWLWCETWCSDETMKFAKTIDLCNNPLTKKPKLEIAQTRVDEWPGLDEEARSISAKPDDYQKFFFNEDQ